MQPESERHLAASVESLEALRPPPSTDLTPLIKSHLAQSFARLGENLLLVRISREQIDQAFVGSRFPGLIRYASEDLVSTLQSEHCPGIENKDALVNSVKEVGVRRVSNQALSDLGHELIERSDIAELPSSHRAALLHLRAFEYRNFGPIEAYDRIISRLDAGSRGGDPDFTMRLSLETASKERSNSELSDTNRQVIKRSFETVLMLLDSLHDERFNSERRAVRATASRGLLLAGIESGDAKVAVRGFENLRDMVHEGMRGYVPYDFELLSAITENRDREFGALRLEVRKALSNYLLSNPEEPRIRERAELASLKLRKNLAAESGRRLPPGDSTKGIVRLPSDGVIFI